MKTGYTVQWKISPPGAGEVLRRALPSEPEGAPGRCRLNGIQDGLRLCRSGQKLTRSSPEKRICTTGGGGRFFDRPDTGASVVMAAQVANIHERISKRIIVLISLAKSGVGKSDWQQASLIADVGQASPFVCLNSNRFACLAVRLLTVQQRQSGHQVRLLAQMGDRRSDLPTFHSPHLYVANELNGNMEIGEFQVATADSVTNPASDIIPSTRRSALVD